MDGALESGIRTADEVVQKLAQDKKAFATSGTACSKAKAKM